MAFDLDPYNILGVSPSATAEEIKGSYRRAARRLHPDVNHDNPGAAVQFQDITGAYELLMDPDQKRAYDRAIKPKGVMQFSMRVTPSKRGIAPLTESQVVYLLAEILPDPAALEQQNKRESRLNLTLILDQSNSMNGTRLERVKVAAHQIIDNLNADDIISVVSFNDRATVVIPATTVMDKPALKAKISMMVASGGTEIYQGLEAGVEQNERFLAPRLVNHIILLTDGNTFGDQDRCIKLAQSAVKRGVSISAMGLGQEWNDEFLDELAAITGGTCMYITSASAVVRFLNDHVRNLSNVFAERMQLSVAPDPDIKLESAFKLSPSPQPLPINEGYIPLGSLQLNRTISILLQFELPPDLQIGFRSIARVVSVGDILENRLQKFQAISDVSLEVLENPPPEEPPLSILDALGKLTLYRMQERAQEALESGDVQEATKRLERLATRLLELGEPDLAAHAKSEARRVSRTSQLSEEGRKTLKFQTRYLLMGPVAEDKSE
jgi:Ca-activated chloride channel homolog